MAIAAIAFMFAGNGYAHNNPAAHHRTHVETLVKIVPTKYCHCHACNEIIRFGKKHNFNINTVNDVRNCTCNTCKDIRHNERVMHNHNMACHTPAAPVKKAPTAPATAHRTGAKGVVSGHR